MVVDPVVLPSPTPPPDGGGTTAGFLWWPIAASIGGIALVTLLAGTVFYFTVEYRRRHSSPEPIAPPSWSATGPQGAGMVIVELSEDDASIPSVSISLTD